MSRSNAKYFDDDDMADEWSEEGEEFYDEYDEPVAAPKPKSAPKPSAKPAAKPAAAAGASALARALVDPAPKRPDGRPQKGGKPLPQAAHIKQQSHQLVPEAEPGVQRFGFDQPSPDDLVLAAQRKQPAGTGTPSRAAPTPNHTAQQQQQRQRGAADAAAGLAGSMQGLSVVERQQQQQGGAALAPTAQQQAAPPPGRPLDEYRPDGELAAACAAAAAADAGGGSGAKPRLHLVVLGHVDAGKSTLMGRMLFELGVVTAKEVHRAQRDSAAAGKGSFAWAWMLDERPEERARGVTVDVAMTRFETQGRRVTLLDAPGHRDFVPNMIAGAAQADAALLVVDGSPGGFEAGFEPAAPGSASGGGQTREHAQLARSLGVEQLAVVVTKLDTCDYDQARFSHIRAQLEPFLRSCGFREDRVQWVPAVGPTGDNLAKPPADQRLAAWWQGPTLAQVIDRFAPTNRLLGKPLRLPVADVSRAGKAGVTVGGKLEGGALRVGGRLLVVPSGLQAAVKSLEVDGQPASLARAGDSADVTLTGIDPAALAAGSVLCHPDFPVPLVTKFQAQVLVLDVAVPILRGQQIIAHAHTARESGRVSDLLALLDGKTGAVQRRRPRCLLKGQLAVVEVALARPMCLERSDDYTALGRVALRDCGRTLAIGKVTRCGEGDSE